MIERYRNEENIYTYDNNIRGRIYGGEVEFQYFPAKNIELFGHYYLYEGKSFSPDQPLNDVPPPHLFIGGKFFFDRLWFEINHLYSFKKNNPGPAEIKNEGYHLLNVKGGYYFSSRLLLYLKISNVLNQWFYANPDPDIPESEGMGVSAGLHCYF